MAIVAIYDRLDDYLAIAAQGSYFDEGREDFYGLPKRQAVEFTKRGADSTDPSYRTAQALLDKVDATAHDREGETWISSVAGAYPIVPEYLSGQPDCMRMRVKVKHDKSPIRIVVEPSIKRLVTHEQIVKRGAAMAALAMKMSETRPVELWVMRYSKCHNRPAIAYRAKMDCHPISLAQCVACFTSESFIRRLGFSYMHAIDSQTNSMIDFAYCTPKDDASRIARDKNIREVLMLDPADIILQCGCLEDSDLMERDPVAWVNKQLEKQREID